jgi:hypothetical protein
VLAVTHSQLVTLNRITLQQLYSLRFLNNFVFAPHDAVRRAIFEQNAWFGELVVDVCGLREAAGEQFPVLLAIFRCFEDNPSLSASFLCLWQSVAIVRALLNASTLGCMNLFIHSLKDMITCHSCSDVQCCGNRGSLRTAFCLRFRTTRSSEKLVTMSS